MSRFGGMKIMNFSYNSDAITRGRKIGTIFWQSKKDVPSINYIQKLNVIILKLKTLTPYWFIFWYQGAGKRPGQWKKEKNPKKIQKIVPVPIYVFVDSEQKAEFKAKIKPCSHQLNCMKFKINSIKAFWVKDSKNFVFLGCSLWNW